MTSLLAPPIPESPSLTKASHTAAIYTTKIRTIHGEFAAISALSVNIRRFGRKIQEFQAINSITTYYKLQ